MLYNIFNIIILYLYIKIVSVAQVIQFYFSHLIKLFIYIFFLLFVVGRTRKRASGKEWVRNEGKRERRYENGAGIHNMAKGKGFPLSSRIDQWEYQKRIANLAHSLPLTRCDYSLTKWLK